MADVEFSLLGLDGVIKRMRSLPVELRKKPGRSALGRAARLVRLAAVSNAQGVDDPETGRQIAQNIVQRFRSRYYRQTGDLMISVGVATERGRIPKGNPDAGAKGNTPHWHLVELGTELCSRRSVPAVRFGKQYPGRGCRVWAQPGQIVGQTGFEMSDAPIYRVAKQSAAVRLLLGEEPRFYPWGENDDTPRVYPYAVFQVVSGSPYNYLSGRPDSDQTGIQVDIYAATPASARSVANAIRSAIELDCYITSWRGQLRGTETKSYRVSFDCDWITQRV